MYLNVTFKGIKTWRINDTRPITKKRTTLTFGLYPDITLAQAYSLRANIKADLAVGFAPFYKVKG